MDDLHIGVTTSRGTVVSYDWNGITEDSNNWHGCLVVFQLNDCCWETQWDTILTDLVNNDCWESNRLVSMIFIEFITKINNNILVLCLNS